jgi:hypothetical protein
VAIYADTFQYGLKSELTRMIISNLLERELTEPLFQREINVLDVGCGPATWLLELATEHPKASFYGIDIAGWLSNEPERPHLCILLILNYRRYIPPSYLSSQFTFANF